ncbi:MAG: hemagglutinin, partial [Gemmatimonadaceae bacterium]|nr:hemagglutinin [Gemmatimonadaceae bacterium]
GSTVQVYDGSTLLGNATEVPGSPGTFVLTPSTPLADGLHSLTATATDAAGNVSAPTAAFALTVDTTAPTAPSASLDPLSDSATQGDSITRDTTPTISGSGATPGDTITLFAPNSTTVLGTAVVAPNGTWSITPTTPLSDGLQNLSVAATDPAGNQSVPTPLPLTIDSTAPLAPAADVAASSDTGVSNTDNITTDNTPTISGTGTNGDTITVTMPTGEVLIAVVANGIWSVTPTQALADGVQNVSVTATDAAGNVSPATSVPLTIDTTAPAIVWSATAPVTDDVPGVTGVLVSGAPSNDTQPLLSFSAEAGSTVQVYDTVNGVRTLLGTATEVSGSPGLFNFTPSSPLGSGAHSLTATATDLAGNTSSSTAAFTLTIDTTAPTAAGVLASVSDTGVSGDGITADTTPTISGTGTAGDTITLYASGSSTPIGSAVVAADGTWSITPTSPLSTGPQSLSITAADPAGNVSAPIAIPSFTIDTTEFLPWTSLPWLFLSSFQG